MNKSEARKMERLERENAELKARLDIHFSHYVRDIQDRVLMAMAIGDAMKILQDAQNEIQNKAMVK
jgi:hypothetical protein